jgi:DNA-binding GntR family transcriptional regulator
MGSRAAKDPPRPSLREEIARSIQAALISGEMLPGQIYSAPTLAESFGVSATPVREALLYLTKEGFVEPVRNRGFRVTAVSAKDVREICELRLMLEVPSVGQVAALAPHEGIESLLPLADEIEEAARERDLITYLDMDTKFHLAMLRLLDNDRLVDLIGRLRGQMRAIGLSAAYASGGLLAAALEHRELLELVGKGDVEGSKALVRKHIEHTMRPLMEQP